MLLDRMAQIVIVKQGFSQGVVVLKRIDPPFYRHFFGSIVVLSSDSTFSSAFVMYNVTLQIKIRERMLWLQEVGMWSIRGCTRF